MSRTKIVMAILIAFGIMVASQFVVPFPFSSTISAIIIVLVLNRYWHDLRSAKRNYSIAE
ncbi:MAG: hypothetical protein WA460_01890 [Nitrososphaeraceae archaeon]